MKNGVVAIEAVREYYRCAFRPNDPEMTTSDVLDFVEYCLSFYGDAIHHGAIYPYDFTIEEICEGMIDRFKWKPSLDFDGDTVDRELVCEMVFDIRERRKVA